MKLEGEIWELELIPQLVELGSQAFTGAIRFENDSVIKIVYFKEGNVLSASTNDRADSIDEILLKSGKVTRDHVKQALSKRKETETLGDALLGLGFIAKRELAWARRVQLIGILRSITEWKTGSFTVVPDYLPKREEGTSFPLPQVVLELVLTEQDRAKYDRLLEGGSAVFRKSASFDGSFASLGLNQEAATIASRIDGVLNALEIASESGSDAFNVYKLLNALNLLGLIEKTENSLEVSVDAPRQTDSLVSPAEPTIEMALDFGSVGAVSPSENDFGPPSSSDNFDMPTFESESSVPAEDLVGYEMEMPKADAEADSGLQYGDEEEPSAPPARSLPMKDSQGLGSIEALRNFELPAAEFPPIEDRIAQKQEKKKPLTAPASRGGRKTGLIAAAALVIVALGAAGGWYYVKTFRKAEQPPVAQVTTPPVKTVTPPSSDTTVTATTTASETSTTSAAPVTATTATTAAPSTTTSAPVAKPPASATTTARAPEPKPLPPPVTTPPAPQPSVPATTPASSSRYASQAQQYVRESASVPFAVQFELVCRDASVEKAINVGGSKIWFLPITYRGEQCYRVLWGRYATREEAERAMGDIPSSLRGGKPSVVSPGAR